MKAAIYSRKSKFTGKGESIGNQVQLCIDYAKEHLRDKEIDEFLQYEDEGFSGGNTNRPKFQKLLEDGKLRKYDILICYRLDRISRNVADFSNTLELLQSYNIDFISIREQFDTTSPMGRAMIYISSVFAQLERETIAERIRDNMLELSKTGRWLGGNTPIGYTSEPISYIDENMKEKSLVKLKQVPEELKLVSLLYEKYLELKSLSKVETFALQNHLKTKRGADFTKANIKLLLANPVYVKANDKVLEFLEEEGMTICGIPDGEHGLLTYNKSKNKLTKNGKIARVPREKSEWIAAMSSQKGIIEANEWINVQKALYENKAKFPNEGKTHNAILTGKLRCAVCGSNMQIAHGHKSANSGQIIFYYTCSMKKYSKGIRCNNKNAKAAEVDRFVIIELKEILKDKNKLLEELIKQNKSNNSTDLSIAKAIKKKEKQIDTLVNNLSKNNDIADSIISKIKSLKNEIHSLRLATEKDAPSFFIERLMSNASIIDSLSIDNLKRLIEKMIDTITWNGNDYTIQIDFNGSNANNRNLV